jgi:Thrombospondin type 1 domain
MIISVQRWAPPGWHPPGSDNASVIFEAWAPPSRSAPPPMRTPPYLGDGQFDTKSADGGNAPPAQTPPPPRGFEVATKLITDNIPAIPVVEGTDFFPHVAPAAPCTRTCGSGWQLTPSVCVSKAMHTTAPLDVCMKSLQLHDARIAACAMEACSATEPHWEVGDWSAASATCDGGFQSREVWCKRNGLAFEAAACGELTQPALVPASPTPCINFGWFVGPWGPCSAACGDGRARRAAVCVDLHNATVADKFCPTLQPALERDCFQQPCESQPADPDVTAVGQEAPR